MSGATVRELAQKEVWPRTTTTHLPLSQYTQGLSWIASITCMLKELTSYGELLVQYGPNTVRNHDICPL